MVAQARAWGLVLFQQIEIMESRTPATDCLQHMGTGRLQWFHLDRQNGVARRPQLTNHLKWFGNRVPMKAFHHSMTCTSRHSHAPPLRSHSVRKGLKTACKIPNRL